MPKWTIYGAGGYCENCDPSHPHPLYNVIAEHDLPEPELQPDPEPESEV